MKCQQKKRLVPVKQRVKSVLKVPKNATSASGIGTFFEGGRGVRLRFGCHPTEFFDLQSVSLLLEQRS